jgi:hypothetical protein
MPPTNGTALALAGRLRTMDDARLGELLRAREVRDSGIKDFFDLADRLLDRASVQAALSRLDRYSLIGLSAGERLDPVRAAQLDALALVVDGVPYDAVADALASWPPSLLQTAEPAALEAVSQVDAKFTDHAAAERAFATTFAVLEVVEELRRQPARELARGGIALPDSKRLGASASVALDELPALVAVAASAGLVSLVGGSWLPTAAASDWQLLSTVDRWVSLAESWIEALPDDLRALLAERRHAMWGDHLGDWVRWLYPASGEWMSERISAQGTRAELLGITAGNAPSTPGIHLLAGETAQATASMAPLFPHEVDKVYLQHDLTIVSPGPLSAPLDSRLRELADVENRGLATTYRVNAETLNRAIYAGATAESLRAFLTGLSLTGIPQPLDYLIAETARRHALVRVGRVGTGAYVRSDDSDLLQAIRVDARLSSLGLYVEGARLESRLNESIIYWALSDARYPVAAEDENGRIVTLERGHLAGRQPEPRDHAREIVERLRATAGLDEATGAAWLERQLDLAIKARIAVVVVVTMPNGTTADYLLEPTGLGGGRLRARDRKADIERTLPLASIVEVRQAD